MKRKFYLLVGLLLISVGLTAADERAQIEILFEQAREFNSNKEWDNVFMTCEESYTLSKEIGYSWGMANSQFYKGWARYKQNELSQSLLLFLEALQIMQNEMEPSEESAARAKIHMNIGRIYRIYSNYEESHNFYDEGLILAEEFGHTELAIKFIYNKGVVYKYSGDLVSATKQFINSKFKSKEHQSYLWYFNSINQLGLINHEIGRYDSARHYYDQALPIAEELSNPARYRAMIYHNKANTYFKERDFLEGERYFQMSLEEKPRFLSYLDLTELYLEQEMYEAVISTGSKAVELYPESQGTTAYAEIFKFMSKAYLGTNDISEAELFIDRYTREIDKYLETKEYTKKLEDAYQIDLLTKQYFLKLEEQRQQAQIVQLSWYLAIVVFMFLIIFGIQKWLQHRKKSDATEAIKAIFNKSDILRSSLDREL